MANPGPIVLDIEKLPLKGSPDTIRQILERGGTPRRLDSCWPARQDRRVLRLQHLDWGATGESVLRTRVRPSCGRVLPIDVHPRPMYTLDDNCAADLTALTLTMMGRLPKVVPTIKM